ncbi:MAG: hypothetical protein JW864_11355 [Spirochaetes bacterium]|nr:hypothetical protein [Spirochaetota bacterium]
MQKPLVIVFSLFVIISVLCFTSSASALGLGGYLSLSKGGYDWNYSGEYYDYSSGTTDVDYDWSGDVTKIGLGFILDTAVAADRFFNYRLNVGYSMIDIANDDSEDASLSGYDFHIYNTFGFGIVRTEKIRFWLGPQIGFGMISAESDSDDDEDYGEFVTFFASAAIAAGMNIHISNSVSIGLDAGYRAASHAGYLTTDYDDYEISGSGKEIFGNVSILFRINDKYREEAQSQGTVVPEDKVKKESSGFDDTDLDLDLD